MSEARILTLNAYADRDHRRMVDEYGVTLAEARSLYPVETYRAAWWRYVVEDFEAGNDFTPQAINTLTAPQLRDLARTRRGLRHGMPAAYLYRGGRIAQQAA